MTVSIEMKKRLALIDLGILGILFLINFIFQSIASEMTASTFISAVRNSILMSDHRTVNQTAVGLLSSSGAIYILIPSQNRIERDRKLYELPIFDIEKQIKLFPDLKSSAPGQVIVKFAFSGLNGVYIVLSIWVFLNLFFLGIFPLIRKQIEKAVIEEQQKINLENLVNLSRQVAHDIRSPVSALEMVLATSGLSEDRKKVLDQVAKRIRGIADDLLNQSRITYSMPQEKRFSELPMFSVDLVPLLHQIVIEKNSTLNDFKIDLECQVEALQVTAAEPDVGRIFSNLLNNSIEALVGDRLPSIKVKVQEYKNRVSVYFQDNGRGIPEHLVKEVGKPGFSFGKANIGGHGLGVSYAKSRLEGWGGSIQILSKENEGTIIILNFKRPE